MKNCKNLNTDISFIVEMMNELVLYKDDDYNNCLEIYDHITGTLKKAHLQKLDKEISKTNYFGIASIPLFLKDLQYTIAFYKKTLIFFEYIRDLYYLDEN